MRRDFALRCSQPPYFRLPLSKSLMLLGRSSACDLVVDEQSVSRKHAEIQVTESGLTITDLGSRNGTYVNEVRVRSVEAQHGQVVRFGEIAFTVQAEELPPDEDETDASQPIAANKRGWQATAKQETAKQLTAMQPAASRRPTSMSASPVSKLSDAQRRVFDWLLTGLTEKTIARRLGLSPHTVHNHVRGILRAFGVHSRIELLTTVLVHQ